MSSEIIKREDNHRTVGAGIDSVSGTDITMLRVDPVTNYILVNLASSTASGGSSVTTAKRDQNHRTVCMGYNETTGLIQELLTDDDGYILCSVL